jgi:hypothetical protein
MSLGDLTREYLDVILPTVKNGWLTGNVGFGGHYDTSGKYVFDRFPPYAFAWPAQAGEIVDFIQQHAPSADVYICPYLMRTTDRTKGDAVWRQLVHTDVDNGQLDLVEVEALGGFAINSGTLGNGHVYIRLTHCVTPEQHEILCRGLAAHLGGDPAKISDNDLLRPPGTFNHKNGARFVGRP